MTTATFPALDEVQGKMKNRQDELGAIFAEAGPEIDLTKVKLVKGTTVDKAAHIRKLNDELTELGIESDGLKEVQKAHERAKMAPGTEGAESGDESEQGQGRYTPKPTKSLGELFTESKAYTGRTGSVGPEVTLGMDLKTLLTTTAGFAPEVFRNDRLVDFATRPLQVADVIPQTTTAQAAVQYMEETTFTNAAAEVAEGGTYPEAALAFTEQTSAVRKIATFLPVTDEQLEDVPRMRGIIDNRLPFMIRQRLDLQILVGNGTAPNLRGILNVVGIQTQAKGTDPVPDAIYKAMVLVQTVGQSLPNLVVLHPLDWQDVRLLRTADGIYIWGNPSDAGPQRIWGLNVALAQAITQNTGLVGDTNYLELAVRSGLDTQVSNSHSTFFVEGKQAIRADIRAALVVYRPTAFCTVTGI